MGEQLRLFDVQETPPMASATDLAANFLNELATFLQETSEANDEQIVVGPIVVAIREAAKLMMTEQVLADVMAALLKAMLREGRVLEDDIIDILAKWQQCRRA